MSLCGRQNNELGPLQAIFSLVGAQNWKLFRTIKQFLEREFSNVRLQYPEQNIARELRAWLLRPLIQREWGLHIVVGRIYAARCLSVFGRILYRH